MRRWYKSIGPSPLDRRWRIEWQGQQAGQWDARIKGRGSSASAKPPT
jgi:hypothetical protein